jgi:methylated-DNA-[protein]-cysteine S-methyltransferase
VASRIRNQKARRAVGGALSLNPFPPVIPCHRVLAKTHLGGFAGGKDLKAKMLELERGHTR